MLDESTITAHQNLPPQEKKLGDNDGHDNNQISKTRRSKNKGLDLKQGDKDPSGNIVRQVFAKKKEKYIIYETEAKQMICNVDEDFEVPDNRKVNKLLLHIGDLVTHAPLLKPKYNSSIAYALKSHLDGDDDGSEDSLSRVVKAMTRHLTRRAKIAYQVGAATFMIMVVTATVALLRLGAFSQIDIRFVLAAIFSSMGGLLSVASSTGSLKVELQDSFYVNMTYGAFRIVVAVITGIIVCFLIEAQIIFAFLKDNPELSGFIIASFLSGFSEKLIPNLMREMEEER